MSITRKKQAKKKRYLKRMRFQSMWKHGKSKAAKLRRLEEARAKTGERATAKNLTE